ncbi:plant UBX domain-containing protein 8-like [Arachis duranensis]|uniref:Plant UBX domain-containing protein 8-like n=1 Tax=Arachis duranensis TaxID=130453 RepID=A0A9C6WFP1_ARADU|nr:plant UBX domain-containing protein 8-like [Arachis duranensis]
MEIKVATPSQNDVAYFMRMTGAPESLALQRIEESGGNVNEAINAHFRQYNNSTMFRPSLLLNRIYKRRELIRDSPNGINGASDSNLHSPQYAVSTSQNETENSSREARDYHYNDHYSSDPSVSQHVSDNDVEEDMIRAAIEASMSTNVNGSLDDDDLAEALSLSLKTAAEEEEEREFIVKEIISKIEQSKATTAEESDMSIILPHEYISQE